MSLYRNDHQNAPRSLSLRPSDATRASLSVGEQVADATLKIQQTGGLLSLFGNKELKRLREDAGAMAAEQAAALVIKRTELARDTGLQAIDLERKQRLAEVAHAQTATTTELQKQAHSAGARAIQRSVSQEHSLQLEIAASRCAPEDKVVMAQFVKQLTIEGIESIYREQQTPFGQGAAPMPRHHYANETSASEAPEDSNSDEDSFDGDGA